jgi:lipopolysaccharide/colanic/teichoic acid biosynthesis glycosyltransferase
MIPRRFWGLFDLAIMALAFWLAYVLLPWFHPLFEEGGLLRFGWADVLSVPKIVEHDWPSLPELSLIYLAVAPASLFVLDAFGAYRPILSQRSSRIVLAGLVAPLPGLSLMALLVFGLRSGFGNRLFAFSFIVLSGLLLGAYRLVLRSVCTSRAHRGYGVQNKLLIGSRRCLARVIEQRPAFGNGYRICGYLDVDGDGAVPCPVPAQGLASPAFGSNGGNGNGPESEISCGKVGMESVKRLGSVGSLGDLLVSQPIHEVVAVVSAEPGEPQGWSNAVVSCCDQLGVTLSIVPYDIVFREKKALRLMRPSEEFPLAGMVLKPVYAGAEALFAKRIFDFAAASLLLVLLSPVLALIALAIKLSAPKQPVIYPWRVIGQSGEPFTSYKFRTMVPNADALKVQLLDRNEMKGPVFKITDDPRVTPVGRFLRKFSLDELPQLWTVVKGDLSLVGPRPAGPHELKRYEFWHKRKLSIKPGMTCLWQVSGRNAVNDFDDWVRMDIEYIEHWSFWLDLKILFRTAWVVVAGTGK